MFVPVRIRCVDGADGRRRLRRSADLFDVGIVVVVEHLIGCTEESHFPALIEEECFVKHSEQPGARLVDRDEDDLVVGQAADDLDDVFRVFR